MRHGTRTRSIERWLRNVGASILAAGALISAPFVVVALTYTTYVYAETGHWYAWGAPTQIGTCVRVVSYALVVLAVIGVTFLGTGHSLAAMRRRRDARTSSPTPIVGASSRRRRA